MAFDYANLTEITTIPNAAGSLFRNPDGKKTYLRLIMLHNTNTTVEAVSLFKVPNNAGAVGAAALVNRFFKVSMDPNQTLMIELPAPGLMLTNTNDSIQASTTTASKVTFMMTGGQE